MSNQLYHNKWHGYNHFTVSLSSYPDSATDPIASESYPFRGFFYNKITGNIYGYKALNVTIVNPGSGYTNSPSLILTGNSQQGFSSLINPVFEVKVDPITKSITAVNVIESGRFYLPATLQLRPYPGNIITRTATVSLCPALFELVSNSLDWGFYSSIAASNSAFFQLYPTLSTTIFNTNTSWSKGYVGYTNTVSNSAKWETVFNFVTAVSSSEKYVGLSLLQPASARVDGFTNTLSSDFNGTGWHVALSSTNLQLNRRLQVNTQQKVSKPVTLLENGDQTITWNTTAQVVYYTLTGNYPLTATQVLNAKKGGKYTMWLSIDYCPESRMRFYFDKRYYNISLKKWDDATGESISTDLNVLQLNATSITRIDFVYDGTKMLGKATHYRTFIDTTDDIYFAGIGLRFYSDSTKTRQRNPVYVNNATAVGNYFDLKAGEFNVKGDMENTGTPEAPIYIDPYSENRTGIFFTSPFINYPDRPEGFRSDFDANSSLYVAGSGISIRYLGSNLQYFNFTTSNAQFPSEVMLTKFISLTSSFDRVIAYLSAGSWLLPQNAVNLVASPDETLLTPTLQTAFPTPPYKFSPSNFISVKQCLSTFDVEVFSGKDRDIASINVNGNNITLIPTVYDGMTQPYNFNNERTAKITFFRVQQDYNIDVSFTNQPTITIPNLLLSLGSLNGFTVQKNNNNKVTRWSNNTENYDYSLVQNNVALAPTLSTFKASRFVSFGTPLGTNTNMLLDNQLRSLSSLNGKFFKGFTTFTVFRVRSFSDGSFVWWVGDYTGTDEQKGFGLVLSASPLDSTKGRLYTNSMYQKYGDLKNAENDSNNLIANKIYVVGTIYNPNRGLKSQTVVINAPTPLKSGPSLVQRTMFFATLNDDMNNYNLTTGKHPNSNSGYSNVDLFDLIIYDRPLDNSEFTSMNKYLSEKYNGLNNYKIV